MPGCRLPAAPVQLPKTFLIHRCCSAPSVDQQPSQPPTYQTISGPDIKSAFCCLATLETLAPAIHASPPHVSLLLPLRRTAHCIPLVYFVAAPPPVPCRMHSRPPCASIRMPVVPALLCHPCTLDAPNWHSARGAQGTASPAQQLVQGRRQRVQGGAGRLQRAAAKWVRLPCRHRGCWWGCSAGCSGARERGLRGRVPAPRRGPGSAANAC